ncbi:MAG: iron-containing alcohol dehydrogenase [Bacillota bacterium]|nr:iron-containing alcohol dehydrogenase [Bacillota bacterium]
MVSTYNQLCPVLFGTEALEQLGEKVKEFGGETVLCIYDKGVEQAGIADRAIKNIEASGANVITYDGVLPDAPKDVIHEAGKLAADNNVNVIVGIGGGSSLDTAKAASILAENPMPISQYYPANGGAFKSERCKLILVPTASGTGSEVTIMSVIHDEDTDAKEFVLRPADLAIVDPQLTVTAPPSVTAATGLDAMSHAIESYTTNCGNPKAEVLSLHAMKLIAENLEKAYKDGNDIDARTNLSFASNLAGMAFSDASVHFGHAAAHEMGIKFNMPHGVACAITLPEVITFSAGIIPEKTIKMAEALGVTVPEGASGEEAGELAAAKVRELMKKVGIKSLEEQGISKEEALACAEGAVTKNWFVICALKEITVDVMSDLIAKMYDNYK